MESMQDIIITCNSILYLMMFNALNGTFNDIKMSNISTKNNEYSFSVLRKKNGTNNKLTTESIRQ